MLFHCSESIWQCKECGPGHSPLGDWPGPPQAAYLKTTGPRIRVSLRESRYCLFKFTQEPLKEPQGPLARLPTLKTS